MSIKLRENDLELHRSIGITHNISKGKRHRFLSTFELTTIALPGILFFLLFHYVPLYGIILAFKEYRIDLGINGSKWVGLDNFAFFFNSPDVWRATFNTIGYNVVFFIVGTFAAVSVAIFLTIVGEKFRAFYKTSILLPYFISWVVVDIVVFTFLDQEKGILNQLLKTFGLTQQAWYNVPGFWPFILIFLSIWKGIGFNALLYYAGIMGIDPTYYEAAKVDGATRLQQVTKITIPLLRPIITILMILTCGYILSSDFGLFYFIPRQSFFLSDVTDTIDTYVFRLLRVDGSFGKPAAIGLYKSLVGLVLVFVTNKIVNKLDSDSGLF